jgi:ParB family chromosome partitioning protein
MADEARSRLGRGLASLIGDVGGEAAHLERPRAQRKIPIEFIKPNPRNPRRAFSDAELGELADSIRQHGVIQPIAALARLPDRRPARGAGCSGRCQRFRRA